MKINSYNSKEEEQFSDVIKVLKSLPKVKADDNFEFNLMTRINNGNFELNTPEKKFYFGRIFVPVAATVAASIVLLFFIISDSGVGVENPFLLDPPVRNDYSAAKVDTIELQNTKMSASVAEKTQPNEQVTQPQPQTEVVRVVVQPSDAVTVEELPFDDANSVDLDTYVSGQSTNRNSVMNRGSLVSGGERSVSQFDGFLIRERPSKETIESHKARLDSLKNAQKSKVK